MLKLKALNKIVYRGIPHAGIRISLKSLYFNLRLNLPLLRFALCENKLIFPPFRYFPAIHPNEYIVNIPGVTASKYLRNSLGNRGRRIPRASTP